MKIKLNKELNNFYLFMMGQFVSQFGSKLTSYGLILWSYKQSGSVLSMSLLSVCYLVPEVMLSFISGGISDRWNKKKIMLVADTIAAIFSFSIILMLFTNTLRIERLYIINVILGITDSFQNPASEVTISAIVSKENYMKTSGFQTFCNSFTGILTPIVATSLYAFCGLKVIVIIDLATFIFAFLSLMFFVRLPHKLQREKEQSLIEQCAFGLKYLLSKKSILILILFMAFVNLIAAIYNTNLAPMVLSRNGNNDIQLGIVSGMISAAGLVGSLLVTKIKQNVKRVPLILNIMTFSFLICNVLLGIGRNYYVWSFAVFAGNVLVPLLIANVNYIMRSKVPYELQGKVFSARNTLQYSAIPIGNLLGGIFADKIFIPYMNKPSQLQSFWIILVGNSNGSGIALLFLCIAVLGVGGCFLFRRSKSFLALDNE